MPLNTEAKGDPHSLRATAGWLTARSGDTHDTGAQVYGARGDSESAWRGNAAEGFRTTMTKAGQKIDQLGGDLDSTSGALRTHADDLDTVKSRMEQAREIARGGGLTVSGNMIEEPGPAPVAPTPLPTDKPATPEQQATHSAATQAQSAYAAKVKAYQEASKVVVEANGKLDQAQRVLLKFVTGYRDKAVFNIADIATGLAGAVGARSSAYRASAKAMDPGITRAARYAGTPRTNPFAQLRADALEAQRRLDQTREYNKATATRTARLVDKLPDRLKSGLQTTLAFSKSTDDIANPLLRGGTKVLSKLPVVGLGITAASTAFDIGTGKDPTTSIASNAGGFVAGSLATAGVAAMGGPVGWGVAAGALVGAGVGFAIEEWGDDAVNVAGDAANWAGDKLGSAGEAVGDFLGF